MVAFIVIELPPGDYLTTYIMSLQSATGEMLREDEIAQLTQLYGLNQPAYMRYFKWIRNIILYRDLGRSLQWNKRVTELIGERVSLTIGISILTTIFTWIVAIPIGIYSAVRQYSTFDYIFTIIGFVGLATPGFLLALIVMWLAFSYLGLNVTGLFSQGFEQAPWSMAKIIDLLKHVWVPILIIGMSGTAGLIRTMRANLLDELKKQYVITARAKGLPERRLLFKYPVRIAINPLISTIGWTLPHIISGETLVSIVLNLPTVGPLFLRAIMSQDMYLAGGIVLILSSLTLIGTLISDILLAWADPRIRYGGVGE